MHRCLAIGVVVTFVVVSGAVGDARPVGPPGYLYYPHSLNDRGDVLFSVLASWDSGYVEGTPHTQTELHRADGTVTRFADLGWFDVVPRGLGPNGEVILGLGYLADQPNPWGGTPELFEHELVRSDGSRSRVDPVDNINYVYGVAPDGAVLGIAEAERDYTNDLPVQGFAWDASRGVTLLEFPQPAFRNWAFYGARDGGYVGFANDGLSGQYRSAVWWNVDGTIASTLDMDLVGVAGIEDFAPAGVLADGTLVGHDFDGNFGGTTVVTIAATGAVTTIPIDVGLGVELFDVNSAGLMVGRQFYEGEYYIRADWMIWGPDGIGFPLNRFLPAETGRFVSEVIDINDLGDVLVETRDFATHGVPQTYVLTNLPSPGGLAIVGFAGLTTLTRRRRASFACGAVLTIAGSASGGVSITPVGPAGSTHYPRALNERGDVVFDVQWGEWGENPGEMLNGPVVLRPDGTSQEFRVDGADFGYSLALGEDGAVVGEYAFPFPGDQGYDTHKWTSRVKGPDAADVPYSGSSPFAFFNGVTDDGTYFGSGLPLEFIGSYDPAAPHVPLAWHPAHGETVLQLPPDVIVAEAQFENPGGGYVGLGYTEELASAYIWWDAQGSVIGRVSADTLSVARASGWIILGGVRGDGALVASGGHQIMALHPDGVLDLFGEPYERDVTIHGVNAAGVAVGIAYDYGNLLDSANAVLWSADGDLLELQSLLPEDSSWVLTDALDITESGDILVQAYLNGNSDIGQAFIIRGIPSPGGVVIAACAGLMVLAYRRRG